MKEKAPKKEAGDSPETLPPFIFHMDVARQTDHKELGILSVSFNLHSIVGVQNEPPQDVPQWYADYFELKAIPASGWSCSLSRSGRFTEDLGRWKKIHGAVGMPDLPLFRGGIPCMLQASFALWEVPTPL